MLSFRNNGHFLFWAQFVTFFLLIQDVKLFLLDSPSTFMETMEPNQKGHTMEKIT